MEPGRGERKRRPRTPGRHHAPRMPPPEKRSTAAGSARAGSRQDSQLLCETQKTAGNRQPPDANSRPPEEDGEARSRGRSRTHRQRGRPRRANREFQTETAASGFQRRPDRRSLSCGGATQVAGLFRAAGVLLQLRQVGPGDFPGRAEVEHHVHRGARSARELRRSRLQGEP